MKTMNEKFTEDEFEKLQESKGDRTWRKAVLEEFGIDGADES